MTRIQKNLILVKENGRHVSGIFMFFFLQIVNHITVTFTGKNIYSCGAFWVCNLFSYYFWLRCVLKIVLGKSPWYLEKSLRKKHKKPEKEEKRT